MPLWLRVGVCVMLVFSLVASDQANAKGKKRPKPALVKKAKVHYENGRDHHQHKEYLAAAKEYLKAYAIHPNPNYLFNTAQVFRLAGKSKQALDYYVQYLEQAPNGRGAADARAHRSALEALITEAEAKAAEDKRLKDEQARAAAKKQEEKEAAAEAAREREDKRLAAISLAHQTPRDPGNKGLRIAGITGVGVGMVSLGLGVKFGLDFLDVDKQVGDKMRDYSEAEEKQRATAGRNATILYGVGAVAVAAGGVLYFMGRGDSAHKEKNLALVPVTTGDSSGLVVHGSF